MNVVGASETVEAVGGHRLAWQEVIPSVQAGIEAALGAAVVGAEGQQGGFSPGMASVLHLNNGRRCFVKAVSTQRSEFSAEAIRREAEVLAQLPVDVPAPALLCSFEHDGWVVLMTEAIDGHMPRQPWRKDELGRFLEATTSLAHQLTPSPISASRFEIGLDGCWKQLMVDGKVFDAGGLQATTNIDALIRLESLFQSAVAGDSLLHGDLRSDNFLLTTDDFRVVDWPEVCIGAEWMDLMLAMPSIVMRGGGDPESIWTSHPLGRKADSDAVNSALAGVAGWFLYRSLQAPIPLLPTIRKFQAAQGIAALQWLLRRVR